MDISLLSTKDSIQINPVSIHGMLWLQTHFEDEHWEALASNKVRLPKSDIEALSKDAKDAGLVISQLTLSHL